MVFSQESNKDYDYTSSHSKNALYKKIQLLSKNEIRFDIDENNEIKTSVNSKIKNIEKTRNEDVMYWKINECIYVIPESTASTTSHYQKKNNIDEVIKFLKNSFRDDYLVISFKQTRITSLFKRCLVFDEIDGFNMKDSYKIAQVCNFWINSKEKRVIVIELKNKNEAEQLFSISCILSYCKFYLSAEVAFKTLTINNQSIWKFLYGETVSRYAKYYDSIITQRHSTKFSSIDLNQVIITTIPSIIKSGDFTPKLKIKTSSRTYEYSSNNCYKDNDYIIFSNLDAELDGDSKISLSFEQGKKLYHVFDLCIHSFLYKQGLYRFSRSDVVTSLPQESIYQFFQEGFYIDLVFLESRNESFVNPFNLPLSMLDLINLMVEKFSVSYKNEAYNNLYADLLDKGFNSSLSMFCARMQLSTEESQKLNIKLEESGYRNSLLRQTFELEIPEETVKEQISIERTEDPIFDTKELYNCEDKLQTDDLELIGDDTVKLKYLKKSPSILFNKKKPHASLYKIKDNVFAKKPLHLVAVKSIENTIFAELKDILIAVDYDNFEKVFCDDVTSNITKSKVEVQQQHKIDKKRIFMVSLLLRQLEIKRITIDEVNDILQLIPEKLGSQELSILLKVLPTLEEQKVLELSNSADLTTVEVQMLTLAKIPEITQILKILIFEKTYIEEMIAIEKLLDSTNKAIRIISTDRSLKFVFKTILEVSNILNYTYGKRKKIVEGFKLESLYTLSAYGEVNSISLIDFVVETLTKNNVSLATILTILRDVEKLKNEDFTRLKESINEIIVKYKDVRKDLDVLEHYDKEKYSKMALFSYSKLIDVSKKFKEFEKISMDLKLKFGDDDKKPINCVFKSLIDFFHKMEESERKKSY